MSKVRKVEDLANGYSTFLTEKRKNVDLVISIPSHWQKSCTRATWVCPIELNVVVGLRKVRENNEQCRQSSEYRYTV
jgi:hypothetical protein